MFETLTESIGFRRRSWKDHLARDIAVGIAAGWVGTKVLERVMPRLNAFQKPEDAAREQELLKVPANRVLADRVGRALLKDRWTDEKGQKFAAGLHVFYGLFWGGVYGALHRRVPVLSRLGGIPFGVLFTLVGNEAVTAGLRLVPPPQRLPVSTHLKTLASHVAYAAAAEGTWRAADRAIERLAA